MRNCGVDKGVNVSIGEKEMLGVMNRSYKTVNVSLTQNFKILWGRDGDRINIYIRHIKCVKSFNTCT